MKRYERYACDLFSSSVKYESQQYFSFYLNGFSGRIVVRVNRKLILPLKYMQSSYRNANEPRKAGDSVELAQFIFEGRLIVCHFGKFCVGSFIMSDFDMHLYAVCCVCVCESGWDCVASSLFMTVHHWYCYVNQHIYSSSNK